MAETPGNFECHVVIGHGPEHPAELFRSNGANAYVDHNRVGCTPFEFGDFETIKVSLRR